MIRRASLWDIPAMWPIAQRFSEESSYGREFTAKQEDCIALARALMFDPSGYVAVALDQQKIVGMILGKLAPYFLNSTILMAHELAWYVLPDYRAPKTHGPRLKAAYETWAEKGGAKRVTIIDPPGAGLGPAYERQGYRKLETHYIRDVG